MGKKTKPMCRVEMGIALRRGDIHHGAVPCQMCDATPFVEPDYIRGNGFVITCTNPGCLSKFIGFGTTLESAVSHWNEWNM